jgi:DNA-binding XRE family transcriptional regulator
MSRDKQYDKELETAKANLIDFKERGDDAIGESWEDLRLELFTPEERAASDLRVKVMFELIRARNEKGISQKKLEELSGVRQPIIARMEKGYTSPQLDTLLKVLAPLGKTLYIGDLPEIKV